MLLYTLYVWHNMINSCKFSLSPHRSILQKMACRGQFLLFKLMISSPCAANLTNCRKLFVNFSISYVQVVGRSLSPTFCVEILEPSGTFVLKNDTQGKFYTPPSLPKNEAHEISDDQLQRGFRYRQHLVNILGGNEYAVEFIDEYESGEEEDEAEVEYAFWICYMLYPKINNNKKKKNKNKIYFLCSLFI